MEDSDEIELSPVCDLNALTREQRVRQQQLRSQLRQVLQEVQELPDGYALRFAAEPAIYAIAAEFMALEHVCCPSFTHALELAPGRNSQLLLRFTGSQGAKAFLLAELGLAG